MTENVLPVLNKFNCRSCGSTHHKHAKVSLCAACWGEFERWMKRLGMTGDESELAINRWMARRLMMDATRLARYGMAGRCEAVSSAGNRGWLDGQDAQCRNRAVEIRDGRNVCFQHGAATSPIYVGDEAHDPYTDMQRVLRDLANKDERFRQCLIAALAEPASDVVREQVRVAG